MILGMTKSDFTSKKKYPTTLIDPNTWRIFSADTGTEMYPIDESYSGLISLVSVTESGFETEYVVDTESVRENPQPITVPIVDGVPGEGSLRARNGLWLYRPGAYEPVSLTGRWVRDGSVPILQANGLQCTARDEYPQPFHADAASPATWQERAETGTGNTAYVTAPVRQSAVPNPFATIRARDPAPTTWAYQDLTHLGGISQTKEATGTNIGGYGARAGLVSDKSGNGLHALAVTTSALQYPEIVLEDGAIWDSAMNAAAGRNIALSLHGATEFTMCAAVRLRNRLATSTGPQAIICARGTSVGDTQTGIWFNHDANRFQYRVRIGSTSTLVATATPAFAPSTVAPLVAVVMLRKTADGVQAWLNGVELTGVTQVTGSVAAALANNVHLTTSGAANELKDGLIGPWFVSRFALTDDEAADLRAYYMSIVGVSA